MKIKVAVKLLILSLPISAQVRRHENSTLSEEASRFPEGEFVASDRFRSGSYIQRVWSNLSLEAHSFGDANTNVAHAGASWLFRWRGLRLAPGVGVAFGTNHFATTPAVTLRWDLEKQWFVTQGLVIQALRESAFLIEEEREATEQRRSLRPNISDANHVSARWTRVTIGGTWEHIHFREGDEWKGGGRLTFRVARHASAILYVLGPGRTEFRAGLMIHPAKKEN
jgi:hypothetical protein